VASVQPVVAQKLSLSACATRTGAGLEDAARHGRAARVAGAQDAAGAVARRRTIPGSLPMRRSLIACALLSGALMAGCDDIGTLSNQYLDCDRIRSISLGNSASGSLDTNDCVLNDGSAVDYYRFNVNSSRNVYVSEQSNTIDPYVAILDEFGNVVEEEQGGGNGSSELTAFLPSGTYYIAVSSYTAGDYGSYSLQTDYQ
jgi:hypothetical protein